MQNKFNITVLYPFDHVFPREFRFFSFSVKIETLFNSLVCEINLKACYNSIYMCVCAYDCQCYAILLTDEELLKWGFPEDIWSGQDFLIFFLVLFLILLC